MLNLLENLSPYTKLVTSLIGYNEKDIDNFLNNHIEFHYKILGIPENSSEDVIKKSYHKLMLLYHPDKTSNTPEHIAKLINNSYEILKDVDKKQTYDYKLKIFRNLAHGAIIVGIILNILLTTIKCTLFIYLPYRLIIIRNK